MKIWILLALCLILPGAAWADSPLTSTNFWKAYQDVEAVKLANDIERLNTKLALFLLAPQNSIDKKAAVINALSWNFHGKENAMLFLEVAAQKYKTEPSKVEARLNADEIFCLAYLTALDDYFKVDRAVLLVDKARKGNSKSFTVAMVANLIHCQARFSVAKEWKVMWRNTEAVLQDRTLIQDMRPQGKDIIAEYMRLYK